MKVVVFGSGSFGTAMATVVARNDHDVVILTRREDVAVGINERHRNPSHLSEFQLSPRITCTTNAEKALENADAIVHAIPLQNTEAFLEGVKPHVLKLKSRGCVFVNTSKGLRSDTLELMHETLDRVLGSDYPCAFFGGPTFAGQLMNGTPSGGVMAATDIGLAKRAARLFSGPTMRVYPSVDVVGVEIGGALKNVIAILAGGLEGMGLGVNAQTLLVTRGCREMTRLGVAMGAREHTMAGLSGIGDLMLTCLGDASRNKAVGIAFGKGQKIEDILCERAQSLKGVAEGVATAPAAEKLAKKLGVVAPMMSTCAACLRGELNAEGALRQCMELPIRPDEPIASREKIGVVRAALTHVAVATLAAASVFLIRCPQR
jgi:glycerol-3-phosphate dehydrogenase